MMLANARQASEFLKALSHEVRLLILCFLIEGEKSVSEIEKMLKLRQPAVSQQLARLRADGLVDTRRNGKNIYYSLARTEVRDVIGVLHDAFCRAAQDPLMCYPSPPRTGGMTWPGFSRACGFSTSPMCWPDRSAAINWRSSAPR